MKSLPIFSNILSSSIKKNDSNRANVRLQGITAISPTNDPFDSRSLTQSPIEGCDDTPQVLPNMVDMIERSPTTRNPEDLLGFLYYQLELSVSSGNDQQSIFAVLEIPSNYPIRTPQILLTPRTSSSVTSSTHSYSYTSTLRTIEQEVNVGCLCLLENLMNDTILNNHEKLEEALDSILSIQFSTLTALLATGATFETSASSLSTTSAPDRMNSAVTGRNRSSSALSKLYGKNCFGLN